MLSVDLFFDNDFITKDGVFVLSHDDQYADNFGKQWKKYLFTQIDSKNHFNISKNFMNELLFNNYDFIKNKTVFEIGSGAGRFTEILVKYCAKICTIDLSEAIFYNVEKNNSKVSRIKGNYYDLTSKNKFDVVICRGVLQHTPNPSKYLEKLFEFCKKDGIVIFDFYQMPKIGLLHPKYLIWRPIIKNFIKYEKLDLFLNNNITLLLKIKRTIKKIFFNSNFFADCFIPVYDYHKVLDLSSKQLEEWSILDTLDGMYAFYDKPKTNKSIVKLLNQIDKKIIKNKINKNYFIVKNS